MNNNTQRKIDNKIYNTAPLVARPTTKISSKGVAKKISFSIPQLIIAWSAIFGLLFGVFLIGFYSGKEQASKVLLQEGQKQALRLPVVNPIAEGTKSGKLTAEFDKASNAEATNIQVADAGNVNTNLNSETASNPKTDTQDRIDFTASNQLPSIQESNIEENQDSSANVNSIKDDKKSNPENNAVKAKEASKPTSSKPAQDAAKMQQPSTPGLPSIIETVSTKSLTKGWYVQVIATPSTTEAKLATNKLAAAGVKSKIEVVNINGVAYHRLMVGPLKDKTQANSIKSKVLAVKNLKSSPFIRNIG